MNAAGKKYLIVNADDFGQSLGINRGIVEAYERGVVTSASLMVRWPAAAEAAAYAREHAELSLGLHIDLGEWMCRAGSWLPLYEVVPLDNVAGVKSEVATQLDGFRQTVGRNPTHVDSHQHVHQREPMRSSLLEMAQDLAIPLRHFSHAIHHRGDFYGQTAEGSPLPNCITIEAMLKVLAGLPAGCAELSCHPGFAADLDTMYRNERAQEVKVLCDPRVKDALISMNIELCSFHDVVVAGPPNSAATLPSV